MNWVDFVTLALLGCGFFWSFRHGFIMEVIYFVAVLGGLLGAFVFYPFLESIVKPAVSSSGTASAASFFLLFVLGAGVIGACGILLHKVVYMIHLGFFDRILGGVFGLIKVGIVISVCLVMLVGTKGNSTPEYIENSAVSKPIVETTTSLMESAPSLFQSFHDDYGKKALIWLRKSRERMQ